MNTNNKQAVAVMSLLQNLNNLHAYKGVWIAQNCFYKYNNKYLSKLCQKREPTLMTTNS